MQQRRQVIGGLLTAGVASLAGCLDQLEGLLEDGVETSADPAGIADDALSTHGYHHAVTESYRIEEELTVGEETVSLSGTSWASVYTAAFPDLDGEISQDEFDSILADLQPSEIDGVAAIATPSEEVAGVELNPAGRLEDEQLVGAVSDQIEGGALEDVSVTGETSATVLGTETTVDQFSATANIDQTGDTYEVAIQIAEVSHEEDIVLGVGAHHVDTDKSDTHRALFEAIEHPVDEPN